MSEFIVLTEDISKSIYFIRGCRVMFDRDLAALYGVPTKRLNEQVRRNSDRFPKDFMFQLSKSELEDWKSQFATSNASIVMGLRKHPYVFTEHGAVMLATILHSKQAIHMSVEIVRAFIQMRYILASQEKLNQEFSELKSFLLKRFRENDQEFRKVWQSIERLSAPPENPRKIGFCLD